MPSSSCGLFPTTVSCRALSKNFVGDRRIKAMTYKAARYRSADNIFAIAWESAVAPFMPRYGWEVGHAAKDVSKPTVALGPHICRPETPAFGLFSSDGMLAVF